MSHKIPVRNLYYLLSYAWDRADLAGEALVGASDDWDLLDLLAHAFCFHVRRIVKRGLDRSYRSVTESSPTVRGRLLLTQSVAGGGYFRREMVCEADEFTPDVLHNQIIHTTLRTLKRAPLDARTSTLVTELAERFSEVSTIALTSRTFHQVQIHRNISAYELPLNICRLIWEARLVDEKGNRRSFNEFLRDEDRMSRIFESFVRNFFAIRQQTFTQGPRVLRWDARPISEGAMSILPVMKTDITLTSGIRTVIVDTKYYPEALVTNQHEQLKLRSGHIYQLFSYLKNIDGPTAEGVLLYPSAGYELREELILNGNRFQVRTINLEMPWRDIENTLLTILN